jgi:hypothetical protein
MMFPLICNSFGCEPVPLGFILLFCRYRLVRADAGLSAWSSLPTKLELCKTMLYFFNLKFEIYSNNFQCFKTPKGVIPPSLCEISQNASRKKKCFSMRSTSENWTKIKDFRRGVIIGTIFGAPCTYLSISHTAWCSRLSQGTRKIK